MRRDGRYRTWLFLAGVLALTGCATYQPRPLAPAEAVATFNARSLDAPTLRHGRFDKMSDDAFCDASCDLLVRFGQDLSAAAFSTGFDPHGCVGFRVGQASEIPEHAPTG